jgi:hypothetical protein
MTVAFVVFGLRFFATVTRNAIPNHRCEAGLSNRREKNQKMESKKSCGVTRSSFGIKIS